MAELVFSHPHRGTLAITGSDRLKWLNGLVTCDVASLAPGRGVFGLALSSTGKIQSDLWVIAAPDRLFISTAPGTTEALALHLDKMLIMEDAELSDVSSDYEWLSLHGPSAIELGMRLGKTLDAALSAVIELLTPTDALLLVPRGASDELRDDGGIARGADLRLGSEAEWQALRIEAGLPLFGIDYDTKHNPHDASLERRAVSWSKGCYLGQEVVCMQDLRGKAKRRLVPLVLAQGTLVPKGTPIQDETSGSGVGEITSTAFSDHLNAPVAIAALKAGYENAPLLLVEGTRARVLTR